MQPSPISVFEYMQSDNPIEAAGYAATQAYNTHVKWFVFMQKDGMFICTDFDHAYPFTGVPCVAELHGQNLPVKE